MFKPQLGLLLLGAVVLPGCSSILSGTSDTISFDSNPPGADCQLVRDGNIIGNVKTPGAVVVQKTKDDIHVTCKKAGYQEATGHLTSEIQAETWGNIILGGGIGWAIDSASGADNDYADHITITMVPLSAAQPAAAAPDVPPSPPEVEPEAGPGAAAPSNWHTVSDEVQAYDGNAWVRIPAAVPLTLVEQHAEMGLFRYPGHNGTPAQAWIGMGDVRPAP